MGTVVKWCEYATSVARFINPGGLWRDISKRSTLLQNVRQKSRYNPWPRKRGWIIRVCIVFSLLTTYVYRFIVKIVFCLALIKNLCFILEPSTSLTPVKYCDTCELEVPVDKWVGHSRTLQHRNQASRINVEDGVELVKTSFRNRISTFRLSSNQHPTSPKDFVNNLKPKVIRLVEDHLRKFDHLKVGVELFGRFLLPSEEREEVKSFNVRFRLVNANTDLEELVNQFNAILGAKFADFSEKDSGKFF